MFWDLPHRLTTVHCAVSIALLCSVSSVALISSGAQAATIGKTVVTSAQHEPLAASIMVSNIEAANFSISLANPIVYQQMGLTPTPSMMVRFQPNSSNTGQLLINTTQPVSKPFVDIILTINDGDQRHVMPKTLLMPLYGSLPILTGNTTIVGAEDSNLAVVSANNAKPLTVKQGLPPALMSSPNLLAPNIKVSTQAQPLILSTAVMPSLHMNNFIDNPNANTINISALNTTPNKTMSATVIVDKPLDILNIQVRRQIKPTNSFNISNFSADFNPNTMANQPTVVVLASTSASTPINSYIASITKIDSDNSDVPFSNTISEIQRITLFKSNTDASVNKLTKTTSDVMANYKVQPNDTLWTISQQIAQQNNLNIQTVMIQIQSQNPTAFINQDAGQLRADAQLKLTNYSLIPSPPSLPVAINVNRQYVKRTNKPVMKETSATMVTGLNTNILASLKSSQQRNTAQAQRFSKTNNTLDNDTEELPLQNQKLAELQTRLNKLYNQ